MPIGFSDLEVTGDPMSPATEELGAVPVWVTGELGLAAHGADASLWPMGIYLLIVVCVRVSHSHSILLGSYSVISCEQKNRFLLLSLAAKLGKTRHMGRNLTTKSLTVPNGTWGRKTSKERPDLPWQRGRRGVLEQGG